MGLHNTMDAKKRAIEVLRRTKLDITAACKAADVARSTFYDWMNNDPDFKATVDEIKEERVDFFEQQLLKLMKGAHYDALDADGNIVRLQDKPNATAVIFGLKTLGKNRGYIEKTEVDMNVAPVTIISPVDQ